MEYTLIGMLWSFCIYSFLGWCLEEVYASLAYRKFTNRGFLHGAVCPIYGVGANIFLLILTPFRKNIVIVYVLSVVIATALEFFAGLVLEKIFHQKWWDYTEDKFNLMGYVCLPFSLLWGLACFSLMYILHPLSKLLFGFLTYYQIRIIITVMMCVFVIDGALTLTKLMKKKLPKFLLAFTNYLTLVSDDIGEFIFDRVMFFIKVREYAMKEFVQVGRSSKKGIVRTKNRIMNMRMVRVLKRRFSK